MSISAVPNVANDLEASEVPARRSSVRARADDSGPFASLFAQVQTAPPQRSNSGADTQRAAEDSPDASNSPSRAETVKSTADNGGRSSGWKSARVADDSPAPRGQYVNPDKRTSAQDGRAAVTGVSSGATDANSTTAPKNSSSNSDINAGSSGAAPASVAVASKESTTAQGSGPAAGDFVAVQDSASDGSVEATSAGAGTGPHDGEVPLAANPGATNVQTDANRTPVVSQAPDPVGDAVQGESSKLASEKDAISTAVEKSVGAPPSNAAGGTAPEDVNVALTVTKPASVTEPASAEADASAENVTAKPSEAKGLAAAESTVALVVASSGAAASLPPEATVPEIGATTVRPMQAVSTPDVGVTPTEVAAKSVTPKADSTSVTGAANSEAPEVSGAPAEPASDVVADASTVELDAALADTPAESAAQKPNHARSSADAKPVAKSKDALVVVTELNQGKASDAPDATNSVTSTAKYISAPVISENAAGVEKAAASANTVAADATAKTDPKSTAKYISVPDVSEQSGFLSVDEAVDDAAKAVAAGAGKRANGVNTDAGSGSSKPEIGPGGIVITPLSKLDSGRISGEDHAAAPNGRLDSTPAILPASDKVAQEKVGAGKALTMPDRPTLNTLSDFTVKGVRYLVSNGEKTISVRLAPESLGELRLEVTSNDNSVSVRMVSANPVVRDALQSQMHGLRESLTRDGFTVAQATVSAQMSSDSASKGFAGRQTPYFSQSASPVWGSGDLGTTEGGRVALEAPRTRTHSGVLNLFA